jgi:hypothetical protein
VSPSEPSAARAGELVEFALSALPGMQTGDGLFCHEVVAPGERASGGRLGRGPRMPPGTQPHRRGRSVRYSLIVLVGLLRAQAAGVDTPVDPAELKARLLAEADRAGSALMPGDVGQLLWADSRSGLEAAPRLLDLLEQRIVAAGGLDPLEGLELAWSAVGCAHAIAAGCDDERAARMLQALVSRLGKRAETPSGLFLHTDSGRRNRFPHFATQIYGIHALAEVSRLTGDEPACRLARRAADKLLDLQLADGAWPWIFDTERGSVVEPYRLYSVHQDAMAPMTLFALSDASGQPRYSDAALRGLEWIWGANELGRPMLDHDAGMLYRSINRGGFRDRGYLWANSLAASSTGRPIVGRGGPAEIERTDRPYHLGWVLEAWCGRADRPA